MINRRLEAIQREVDDLKPEEKVELAMYLLKSAPLGSSATKPVDLNRHAGKELFPVDGLEWQKSLRADWAP
jgi:hypothetical protein